MKAFDLDTPLFELAPNTAWRGRHAVEGVQVFGGIGSGKTSGSAKTLADAYVEAGFGGLVLTVKPDEKQMWEGYCAAAGRLDDLIIVEPKGKHAFDFLAYESREGMTDNIMQVLKTVIRASEEKRGGGDNKFWDDALDMLICNVIDLSRLAYGKVDIQVMYDIVQTLPRQDQVEQHERLSAYAHAFDLALENIRKQVEDWKRQQSTTRLFELSNDEHVLEDAYCRDLPDARIFRYVKQFITETYMNLSEKTRSIIDFSFSGFLFRLLRDPVYSLFCNCETTFTPEDSASGKIILINLPVKIYHKIGQDAQIMFKYIWQRVMEKRHVDNDTMPVFLWADEAQNVLHEHDADYQATARSSRIATVYITQNMANYYANMGGAKSEFKVKSFLGTLGTKIFHANADVETNKYASELIGDIAYVETSKSYSLSKEATMGRNRSMRYDRKVRPEEFSALKTGGELNKGEVEAYVHLQAHVPNCFKIIFDQ